MLLSMDLIYPINFVGHDEWMNAGYNSIWQKATSLPVTVKS